MFYVYILLSKKDNKFYIGYTKNVERRFVEHQLGKVVSTKNRRPLLLVGYEGYQNKEDAISREKYFKSGGKAHNDLLMRFKNILEQFH